MRIISPLCQYVVAAGLIALQFAQPSSMPGAELSGVINDPVSTPIEGCDVRLLSLDRVLEVHSDKQGRFQFENLTPGRFDLEISSPGFISLAMRNVDVKESMKPLVFSLSLANAPNHCGPITTTSYDSPHSDQTELSVVVFKWDRHEKPLKRSKITIFNSGVPSRPAASALTDQTGTAHISGLSPGRYDVRITRSGYYPQEIKGLLLPHENSVVIRSPLSEDGRIFICQ